MPRLNDAGSLRLGADTVTRIYLGSQQVWAPGGGTAHTLTLDATAGTAATRTSTRIPKGTHLLTLSVAQPSRPAATATVSPSTGALAAPEFLNTVVSISNRPEVSEGMYKLDWTTVTGATAYELQISSDSDTWTTIVTQAGTSVPSAGFGTNGPVYFRVRATNGAKQSPWSLYLSFASIRDGVYAPVNPTVVNGLVNFDDMRDARVSAYEIWTAPDHTGPWTFQVTRSYPALPAVGLRPSPSTPAPWIFELPHAVGERLVPTRIVNNVTYYWVMRWHYTNATGSPDSAVHGDLVSALADPRGFFQPSMGILTQEVTDPHQAHLLIDCTNLQQPGVRGGYFRFGLGEYPSSALPDEDFPRAVLNEWNGDVKMWTPGQGLNPGQTCHEISGHPVFSFRDMYSNANPAVPPDIYNSYVGAMSTNVWPTADELYWAKQVMRGVFPPGETAGPFDNLFADPNTTMSVWLETRNYQRAHSGEKTSITTWQDPAPVAGRWYKVRAIARTGTTGAFTRPFQ